MLATGFRMGVKHRSPVTIGYPTVDLDTLLVSGALDVFATHGVRVQYRAVARRIQIVDGAVTGVLLADGTVVPADGVVCAVPNSNVGGLLDELPEHAEIYSAADKLSYTPIVSTNLYLDRPLGTESAFEGLIGGTGVIDEVFDRQIMHGRSTEHGWLYCLTTSGAYEQIHRTNAPSSTSRWRCCAATTRPPGAPKWSRRRWSRCHGPPSRRYVGMDSLRPPQRTSVP